MKHKAVLAFLSFFIVFSLQLFGQNTIILQPPKGLNSAGNETFKLFFKQSGKVIFDFNFLQGGGNNYKLKIGKSPGNYNVASIPVSGSC